MFLPPPTTTRESERERERERESWLERTNERTSFSSAATLPLAAARDEGAKNTKSKSVKKGKKKNSYTLIAEAAETFLAFYMECRRSYIAVNRHSVVVSCGFQSIVQKK